MTNFPKTTRYILLVFGLLTSGSGCHVLSIPVNPAGGLGAHLAGNACEAESHQGMPMRSGESHYHPAGGIGDGSCPPDWLSPLPHREFVGWPVPGWWADWKAKKDLPEPPAYPRFHPLPTRPMFQSRQVSGGSHWGNHQPAPAYGRLPDTQAGHDAWQSTPTSWVGENTSE